MWRTLILVLVLFTGTQTKSSKNDAYKVLNEEFASYVNKKCLKNAGEDAYEKLKNSIEDIPHDENITKPFTPKDIYTLVCVDVPRTLYPYLENVMQKLTSCLDEEAMFLTDFILNTFNETLKERCADGEKIFSARINAIKGVECEKLPIYTPTMVGEECAAKMLLFQNGTEIDLDFVITKSYFCKEFVNVARCITETLTERCNSDELSKYVGGFLEPSIILCEEKNVSGTQTGATKKDAFKILNEEFTTYVNRKCLKNANEDAYEELKNAIEDIPHDENLTQPYTLKDIYILVCSDVPRTLYPYLENVMQKLTSCLDEEAIFLADFILNTFNDTLKERCADGEKAFSARISAIQGVECENLPIIYTPTIVGEECATKMLLFRNGTEIDLDFVVTKSYFCKEFLNVAKCITEALKERCNSDELSTYVGGFLEPSIIICKGEYGNE